MDVTEKNPVINMARKFFWGRTYPLVLLVIALVSHVSGLDLAGYAIFSLCAIFINLFLNDARPLVPTVLIGGTCTSAINAFGKGVASDFYSSPFVLGALVTLGALVVASMIAHMIIYKTYRGAWAKLKKSPIAIGILALVVAMLLGGIFTPYYDHNAIIVPGVYAVIIIPFYLYFRLNTTKREDTIDYLAYSLMIAGIGVACQVLAFYGFNYRGGELGSEWKDSMLLGAYVSNSAGEFIVITLPVYFMFASKRSHGWMYILGACLMLCVVALTLSRASLLFAVPVFIFGLLWCSFKGKNKKFSRIFTACCVVLGVAVIIVFFVLGGLEKLGGFFGDTGFADRGRFSLWKQMIESFCSFPIFGAGFSVLYQLNNHASGNVNLYTALAHNTIFQMIGSCGVVGILAYAFHRFTTVSLFVKRFNADRLFLGVVTATFALISLLDQIFFFPQFVILYAMLQAFSENDYDYIEEEINKTEIEIKTEENQITEEKTN
ncbi:MAG: O-antigen ligase family protein [Clostridia bacterium]|nr:O-antigen ligase family protein [Clostridia bacterium]